LIQLKLNNSYVAKYEVEKTTGYVTDFVQDPRVSLKNQIKKEFPNKFIDSILDEIKEVVDLFGHHTYFSFSTGEVVAQSDIQNAVRAFDSIYQQKSNIIKSESSKTSPVFEAIDAWSNKGALKYRSFQCTMENNSKNVSCGFEIIYDSDKRIKEFSIGGVALSQFVYLDSMDTQGYELLEDGSNIQSKILKDLAVLSQKNKLSIYKEGSNSEGYSWGFVDLNLPQIYLNRIVRDAVWMGGIEQIGTIVDGNVEFNDSQIDWVDSVDTYVGVTNLHKSLDDLFTNSKNMTYQKLSVKYNSQDHTIYVIQGIYIGKWGDNIQYIYSDGTNPYRVIALYSVDGYLKALHAPQHIFFSGDGQGWGTTYFEF
jgi:hypothetical protein